AARGLPAAPGRGAVPGGDWLVVVGFEESGDAVRWQVGQLIKEVPAGQVEGLDALADAATEPLWRALCDFRLLPGAVLTFKANLLPHAVADFCRLADGLDPPPLLHAHAGSGVVVGHVTVGLTPERAAEMLRGLRDVAVSARG